MKEIKDILEEFKQGNQQGFLYALATVVHVKGSSYRKPGARMLIREDGRSVGAISGGCLEDDIIRKGRFTIKTRQNRLFQYETTDEDDQEAGLRLGCNGTIYILVEPLLKEDGFQLITMLQQVMTEANKRVIISFFSIHKLNDSQIGTKLNSINTTVKKSENKTGENEMKLEQALLEVFQTQRSKTLTSLTSLGFDSIFIHFIQPPIHIHIMGSGYDVIPLVNFIKLLGWEFNVYNKRPSSPSHGNFHVEQFLPSNGKSIFSNGVMNKNTAVVLMSHNYLYDKAILYSLLKSDIGYLGMLGPRAKLGRMRQEHETELEVVEHEYWDRIHSPIGLDFGAETAEEIALAIVAQIQINFGRIPQKHQ